jgi:hypothetical protein
MTHPYPTTSTAGSVAGIDWVRTAPEESRDA